MNSMRGSEKRGQKKAAAMAAPTPGQVMQETYDNYGSQDYINGSRPASTPGSSALERSLQEQQDFMDSVRAANTHPSNSVKRQGYENLTGRFNAPLTAVHEETADFRDGLQSATTSDGVTNDINSSLRNMNIPLRSSQHTAASRSTLTTDDTDSKRVHLKSVITMTPYESEAETNILRAVDELEQLSGSQHSKRSTDTPFFSNVPEGFIFPQEVVPSEDSEADRLKCKHQKQISELSSSRVDEEESTNRRHASPFMPSTSVLHKSSLITDEQQQRQKATSPSPKRQLAKDKALRRLPSHRNTLSIEQRLFGLTAAIGELDQMATAHVRENNGGSAGHGFNEAPSGTRPLKGHRRLQSSADRLAEKANTMVFHAKSASRKSLFDYSATIFENDIETPEGVENDDSVIHQPALSDASISVSSTSGFPRPSSQGGNVEEKELGSTGREASVDAKREPNGLLGAFRPGDFIFSDSLQEEWQIFHEYWNLRKKSALAFSRTIILFVLMPALALATISFHVLEEQENTTDSVEEDENATVTANVDALETEASVSWWLLFMGVRQVITLVLAMATQSFVIDFFVIGNRFSLRLLGPVVTVLLIQAKGWPFILFCWALYDLCLLAGSSRFVNHWLYWQDFISMMNDNNPSGNVTSNAMYLTFLNMALGVGATVAFKRFAIGLLLGKQTFIHYGKELAKIMKRMVLVSEVASLSRLPARVTYGSFNDNDDTMHDCSEWRKNTRSFLIDDLSEGSFEVHQDPDVQFPTLEELHHSSTPRPAVNNTTDKGQTGSSGDVSKVYSQKDKQMMIDLLERWEEPERIDAGENYASLSAVLQFRRALPVLKRQLPFSAAFGPSYDRESMIESAESVFDRLLCRQTSNAEDEDEFNFDVIAMLALDTSTGELDEYKLKQLIKVFRPNRDGKLSRLAFVKSVDAVYKRMRFLSANIHNSSQIDMAIENVFNMGFYFILVSICLGVVGIDPWAVFASVSSILLAFAFVFGASAASYFSGMLLIVVQKPYGVGDRIHVSNSESEVSLDGSSGWIVEKVTLFSTTVCFGATNERATVSNGTLSASRIINAARSPNAIVYVHLKFGIDVPYEKMQSFQTAVEAHVKSRPREWLAFCGFRAAGISVDLGFIEYKVVVQHRDKWQNLISILDSKARLTTYCLECAKQLDMRFISPPLPINLNISSNAGLSFPGSLAEASRTSQQEGTQKKTA